MSRLADNPKLKLRTNTDPKLSCGVVKVDLPSVSDLAAFDKSLYTRFGMAFSVTPSGPIRGIRISPHIYNTLEQMDAVADAFSKA